MNPSQELKCNQCLEPLTAASSVYKMPKCSHNICSKCLAEIRSENVPMIQCEFCSSSVSCSKNKIFTENKSLMKRIKNGTVKVENNPSISSSFDTSFKNGPNSMILDDGELLLEDDSACDLRQSISPEDRVETSTSIKSNLCPLHDKLLEIICTTDLTMICPHCAIFGNHKDHKFKTVKEFNKDYDSHCELLQAIKHQKYISDKKMKAHDLEAQSEAQTEARKKQLREVVEKKFIIMIEEIKKAQAKAYQELEKHFDAAALEIAHILQQENKIEHEYSQWETQCEDLLNKIQEGGDFNEKIRLMYGPLKKVSKGSDIIDRIEKRNLVQSRKVENVLSSITVDFPHTVGFANIVKINRKVDEKKQSFMTMIEKINLPTGKHILEDLGDFDDNSFICDYSKGDLSLILDGEVKKSSVTTRRQTNRNDLGKTVAKLGSPNHKAPSIASPRHQLARSKSNYQFAKNQETTGKGSILVPRTEKKISCSRMTQAAEKKDAKTVVEQFIKQDLKEVLDLSKCELDDQNACELLKQIRKQRKIRGLKLSQNEITDSGFAKFLEYLNSTSNLNLSYNKMTEQVLTMIIKNRDTLAPLRIINLSFNKINQKKAKTKIDALKKMGIIVNI